VREIRTLRSFGGRRLCHDGGASSYQLIRRASASGGCGSIWGKRLALRVRYSQTQISLIATGHRVPSRRFLELLHLIYGVDPPPFTSGSPGQWLTRALRIRRCSTTRRRQDVSQFLEGPPRGLK
jgi:hypothetical protein